MTDSELLLAMSDLLDKKLDAKLHPIKKDIKSIRDEQTRMNNELDIVKTDLTVVKNDLDTVKNEQAIMKLDLASVKDDLAAVKDEQAIMKLDLASVRDDLAAVKDEQTIMKQELTDVKAGLTRLSLIVENDIQNSINILVENYVPAAQRYQIATDQIKTLQIEQDVMKKTLLKHGEILQKIS